MSGNAALLARNPTTRWTGGGLDVKKITSLGIALILSIGILSAYDF
jgi:hypothetical protein